MRSPKALRDAQPGQYIRLERGLYARRTSEGQVNYGICYRDSGGRIIRRMVGPSKDAARYHLNKARKEVFEGVHRRPQRFPTLRDACDRYLEEYAARKKSRARDAYALELLCTAFPNKRVAGPGGVTTWDLQLFQNTRDKLVSKASVNRELSIVRGMFSRMVEWGVIETNPAKGVKMFREPERPIEALNDEEAERLIAACVERDEAGEPLPLQRSPYLQPLVVAALNTGMRRGELFGLQWDAVDLRARRIVVKYTKNGRIRNLPINEALLAMFQSLPGPREGFVFRGQDGEPIRTVQKSFESAVRRSGVRRRRFHDLRHTFATRLVLRGVDLKTVKELMGHSTILMTARYSHPTPEDHQRAVSLLDSPSKFTPSALEPSKALMAKRTTSS